jgi:hypothetical protein
MVIRKAEAKCHHPSSLEAKCSSPAEVFDTSENKAYLAQVI